jgi:hypothetical protein
MSERITLPRPNRDKLIEIRRGKYSLSEIRELGAHLESGPTLIEGAGDAVKGIPLDNVNEPFKP